MKWEKTVCKGTTVFTARPCEEAGANFLGMDGINWRAGVYIRFGEQFDIYGTEDEVKDALLATLQEKLTVMLKAVKKARGM